MGIQDEVAKIEKDKERVEKQEAAIIRQRRKVKEDAAKSVYAMLRKENAYLKGEGFVPSQSTSFVTLDHELAYILISCSEKTSEVSLFIRDEPGSKTARAHSSGTTVTKSDDEVGKAVAARISIVREL